MGLVITGKFTIHTPVTVDDLKKDWDTDDRDEVLISESEQLTREFASILGIDNLDTSDKASAEIKVVIAEEE